MDDVKTRPAPSYEGDFFAWTEHQGRRLRELRPSSVGWENVAEEIETLGRSEKRSIESNLGVLLRHLLKWQYRATGRDNRWRASIAEHRKRLRRDLKDSLSLRRYPSEVLGEECETARLAASGETGLPEATIPISCPYSVEQVLDPDFWPDAPQG